MDNLFENEKYSIIAKYVEIGTLRYFEKIF